VDGDLNGPSLPRMLSASAEPLRVGERGVVPAAAVAGVRLISIDLLLQAEDSPLRWSGPTGDASLWRGALETGALRELIADVDWGELDFLLVDLPPGTDRIERFLELIPAPAAIVLVTTPSAAAGHVVAKSARLLAEAGIHQVGLVNNMSGYVCPCCGNDIPLFAGDRRTSALENGPTQVWAEIPFDPSFSTQTDGGSPYVLGAPQQPAAQAIFRLAERLEGGLQ
jgi:ATP-binding protein involved in chromosome partitioning